TMSTDSNFHFATLRTTTDLIEELKQHAEEPGCVFSALVVGFERSTSFVFSDDANSLDKLNAFIRQGGEPVGIVSMFREGCGKRVVIAQLLAEYSEESWAQQYLASAAAKYEARLRAHLEQR